MPTPQPYQLSAEARAWHAQFETVLTARDTAAYVACLHPECSIQINNALPLYGKAAITQANDTYLKTFQALNVEVLHLFGDDRRIGAEALFNYKLTDGTTEIVPCGYFLDRDAEGLITSVRIYGNATRLFKAFMRRKK